MEPSVYLLHTGVLGSGHSRLVQPKASLVLVQGDGVQTLEREPRKAAGRGIRPVDKTGP